MALVQALPATRQCSATTVTAHSLCAAVGDRAGSAERNVQYRGCAGHAIGDPDGGQICRLAQRCDPERLEDIDGIVEDGEMP